MPRTTRAIWKKRVERWERNGQTAARFAARLRVNPGTLKWWRWALSTEQPRRSPPPPRIAAAQFVELVQSAPGSGRQAPPPAAGVPSGSTTPDDRVELCLPTGVRILLPRGFDVDSVSGLVAAIERW
ncbi:MAG: hypothetical protein HY905_09800 [Deltaproteobacteria bacterium]|nr:hypothetical protein [Deltaproteobacteria bacterium]